MSAKLRDHLQLSTIGGSSTPPLASKIVAHLKDGDRWLVEVLRGGSCLGMDGIDPTSAIARARFIKSLVGASEDDQGFLAKTLLGLAARMRQDYFDGKGEHERLRSERRRKRKPRNDSRRPQTWSRRPCRWQPTLRSSTTPDKTIRALGVAGEKANAPLLYLVVPSQTVPDPISCVVKGESSGGKNNLVEKTLRLFPADVLLRHDGNDGTSPRVRSRATVASHSRRLRDSRQ